MLFHWANQFILVRGLLASLAWLLTKSVKFRRRFESYCESKD